METPLLALAQSKRWLAWPTLVLVLGAGCSSALDNRQRSDVATDEEGKPGQGELRFPNQDLAAKHKAAMDSPQSLEPVLAYARAVTDFCLASLVDKTCASCTGGQVKYKPTSELDPHTWVLIEDVMPMLDALMNVKGLASAQMAQLVAAKGRLLWLAGNSADEQTLIDDYARAHPNAVAVIRRRLELLREAGDVTASESQCARSRAKMKSAPDAARLDLLTSCVALHPDNTDGRTDPPDYTKYLPNLAKAEERLYRTHLVQRCVENLGDQEARCAQACACNEKPVDKKQTATCKQTCPDCRNETAQQITACKKIGEVSPAPAHARAHRTKSTSAHRPKGTSAHRPKSASTKRTPAPRPKKVDPGTGPQQVEL